MYWVILNRPTVEVAAPTVFVVVASKPVETGILLTKDHVKLVGWPKNSQVSGTFATIEDVVDRGLIAAVVENEPIIESKLAPKNVGGGLPPMIQPRMRAMSVKVNEVIGVAGFVTPGTRVDVLVTMREQTGSVTRVVVSNVQVLAAGTRFDDAEAKRQGRPIPSSVVTLMVSPADAERIALAASGGQIVLALRNPLDNEDLPTPGVTTAALMAGRTVSVPAEKPKATSGKLPPPLRLPPPPPPQPPCTVLSIRAGKKEIVPCP
jgi:pilus assembly protein CpaB